MNTINEQKLATLIDKVFEDGDYEANFSDVSEADWDILLWDKDQMKDAIKNGILYGIVEFVNFLWHDATEEPKNATHILVISDEGNFLLFYNTGVNWQLYAKRNTIKRWCYFSDLLSKEE